MKDLPGVAAGPGAGADQKPTVAGGSPKAARAPRWLDDEDPSVRVALTRRRIVEAALDLVDNEGHNALSMRRLSAKLDVAPMSLYGHVTDKRELIDLMIDHVIGEVCERVDRAGTWQDQLRSIVRSFRDSWDPHGAFISVYSTGVTLGPNAVVLSEWLIKVLRDAGFSDRDSAYALYALVEYVVGNLQFSPVRTAPGAQPEADGQFHSRVSEYFAAVNRDEIPNIVAVDDHLDGDSFAFALDLLIDGLEVRLARTEAAAAAEAGSAPH
jgi:AcrR family transcriptional regulator